MIDCVLAFVLCIRLNNAGKWACDQIIENAVFSKKNHLFRWSSFWSWRVCKQAIWGHRKLARIHWKADAPKMSHCLVRILVQRHNWSIFIRKWARRGRYSQWRSLSGVCWTNFCSQKLKRRILATFGFNRTALRATQSKLHSTLDVLRPVFEDRIISHKADVVWPPRSCNSTLLDYYLWSTVLTP